MTISTFDHELPDLTHNLYDVTIFGDIIYTVVTATPSFVDQWISQINQLNNHHRRLVIGLDVEWRPNFHRNHDNPIATIQLCIDNRCLIFQLIHSSHIPNSLVDFLADESRFAFVGVGIDMDAEKLLEDYNLRVARKVELRTLVNAELRNAGLKNMAMAILGKEVAKPKRVTMSRWDNEWLTKDQVQYACVDAYLSCQIGIALEAWK